MQTNYIMKIVVMVIEMLKRHIIQKKGLMIKLLLINLFIEQFTFKKILT